MSPQAFQTLIVQPGEGKRVRVVNDTVTFIVTGDQSGGAFSLFDNLTPPGAGIPPHVHTHEDEAFWLLEGELRFMVDGETVDLGPGGFVMVPRGVAHGFENVGTETARMLIQTTPGGFDQFFSEVGEPIVEGEEPGPPDVERVIAISAQYGIEFLPPGA